MTNPTLEAPALAPGVTLLGEYQGSGFTEPHYLIVRADQQVLHVSRLLFVVASHIDGRSPLEQVAARVSEEYGRTLDADGVQFLVTAKLQPMGLVADAPDGDPSSFGLPAAPAAAAGGRHRNRRHRRLLPPSHPSHLHQRRRPRNASCRARTRCWHCGSAAP